MRNCFFKNNRILIVEDSQTQGIMLLNMVINLGYAGVYKTDGLKARKYLENLEDKNLPGLIISDIQMPEMDGLELCRFVREKYPEIIFIMITSHDDPGTMESAYQAGASDFIAKPILESELKIRIQNLVQIRNSELQTKKLLQELQEKNTKLAELSITDELTQIYNRRYIIDQLKIRITECERFDYPLSILMIDIDFFKEVNDTYGHLVGDTVLYTIAQEINNNSRKSDLVARYGGEEFLLLLPGIKIDNARIVAEKIRRHIRSINFNCMPGKQLTISGGVAEFQCGMTAEILLETADNYLYQAKEEGKDKTEG